jgi:hypothetical protein
MDVECAHCRSSCCDRELQVNIQVTFGAATAGRRGLPNRDGAPVKVSDSDYQWRRFFFFFCYNFKRMMFMGSVLN